MHAATPIPLMFLSIVGTHHVRVVGGHRGQQGAEGGVLLHLDVGVGAGKHRRVVVHVPQLDGDPGGVDMGEVVPPAGTLREEETRHGKGGGYDGAARERRRAEVMKVRQGKVRRGGYECDS